MSCFPLLFKLFKTSLLRQKSQTSQKLASGLRLPLDQTKHFPWFFHWYFWIFEYFTNFRPNCIIPIHTIQKLRRQLILWFRSSEGDLMIHLLLSQFSISMVHVHFYKTNKNQIQHHHHTQYLSLFHQI